MLLFLDFDVFHARSDIHLIVKSIANLFGQFFAKFRSFILGDRTIKVKSPAFFVSSVFLEEIGIPKLL
jgi:hypothetical protein